MLSYELLRNINNVLSIMEQQESLINTLKQMHHFYTKQFRSSLSALLRYDVDRDEFMENYYQIKEEHIRIILIRLKKVIAPSILFKSLEIVKEELSSMNHVDIKNTLNLLNNFSSLLDTYLLSPDNIENNLELIYCGNDIYQILDDYNKFVKNYINQIMPEIKLEKNTLNISILLYHTTEYNQFANKLLNIQTIYNEICHLLNISNYPIGIIKIESGSFFSNISGHKTAITLLANLIERGIKYLYDNYTRDGKVLKIPKTVESVDSVLKLSASLKQQGIETKEIDELLKKSTLIIANNLNYLLLGEPVIELRGKVFSLTEALEKGYIEGSKKLYIENMNE